MCCPGNRGRRAALRRLHPGRVGDDRLLERDLRAVREARDHVDVHAPAGGEPVLRRGVARPVLEALDVAAHERPQPDALDEPVQVHLDARLVAIAGAEHDAGRVGLRLEDRPDRSVELGVHEHDVLAAAIAPDTTWVAYSTVPVTSRRTSMPSASAQDNGSPVRRTTRRHRTGRLLAVRDASTSAAPASV